MQLVSVLALGFVVGCGRRTPTPEPTREPLPSDADAAITPDATIPPDAAIPTDAAIAIDAPIDAAVGALVETPGTGTCKVDADCELSSYQSGCCVQGCEPYARNKRELQREIAGEQATCDAFRKSGKPCPPPAPCPRRTHEVLAAKCVKKQCYTVTRTLTP